MSDSDTDDEGIEHHQFKVIVVGDGAVGKTSLINRFCQEGFAKSYKQTIGVDFFNKKVVLPGNVNVTLQIWDIGGQQIGGKMLGKYVYGSAAILFVYDVTNPDSHKNLEDWLDFIKKEFRNTLKRPYLAVVGNKIDLPHLRQVKPDKHKLFAEENQLYPYVCSAKSGEKIGGLFFKLAAELAGVQVSKMDIEGSEMLQVAQVVDHETAPISPSQAPRGPPPEEESSGCSVM